VLARINAQIHIVDEKLPPVEAFAVEDSRFLSQEAEPDQIKQICVVCAVAGGWTTYKAYRRSFLTFTSAFDGTTWRIWLLGQVRQPATFISFFQLTFQSFFAHFGWFLRHIPISISRIAQQRREGLVVTGWW